MVFMYCYKANNKIKTDVNHNNLTVIVIRTKLQLQKKYYNHDIYNCRINKD